EVVGAATAAPAAAIRRAGELGSLAPGSEADLTGFELRTGEWVLPDGAGESEAVETLVVPRLVVRARRAHPLDPGTPKAGPPGSPRRVPVMSTVPARRAS